MEKTQWKFQILRIDKRLILQIKNNITENTNGRTMAAVTIR